MSMFARFRRVVTFVMAAYVVMPCLGCGGGDSAPTVQVDEVREKALTDSMRGYFDKENKKESKKETKDQSKKESNP